MFFSDSHSLNKGSFTYLSLPLVNVFSGSSWFRGLTFIRWAVSKCPVPPPPLPPTWEVGSLSAIWSMDELASGVNSQYFVAPGAGCRYPGPRLHLPFRRRPRLLQWILHRLEEPPLKSLVVTAVAQSVLKCSLWRMKLLNWDTACWNYFLLKLMTPPT